MEFVVVLWIVVWCAVLAGIVAARKGLPIALWVVLACLSGPIALVALAGLPSQRMTDNLAGIRESLGNLESLGNRQREELAELLFRLLEATIARR